MYNNLFKQQIKRQKIFNVMNVFINLWHGFSASSAGWTKTLVVEKLFKIWGNAFLFIFLQTKTF